MTTFSPLPTLPGATACQQVPTPGDVDFTDMEYTAPGPFSLPITSADTKNVSAVALAEENARLRQALEPFALAGQMYRQLKRPPAWVALVLEGESEGATLRVGDFLLAESALGTARG